VKLKQSQVPNLNAVIPKMSSLEVNLSVAITNIHLPMFLIAFQYPLNDLEFDIYLTALLLMYLIEIQIKKSVVDPDPNLDPDPPDPRVFVPPGSGSGS
jgi:hypothetical protein